MRGIVLPFVTALNIIHAVAATDVGIAVEIVVPVDVDVAAAPAAAPTPTAAPRRADCHANAK